MRTPLSLLVLLALLCSCCSSVRGAECSFSNQKGHLQTFFNTFDGIATFPCSYKLADVRCGNLQTAVTFTNSVGDQGQLYISDVTVDVTAYDEDGSKQFRRINSLSERRWDSEGAWKWENKGGKSSDDQLVKGDYNPQRQAYSIQHGDLRVELLQPTDTLSVSCKDSSLTSATPFPQALCGSKENKLEDVTSLDQYLPTTTTADVTGVRLDYTQLVLQDVKQTDPLCLAARKLVKGGCGNKGDQLAVCHQLYNPNDNFGRCLAQKFNAFRVYQTCVRAVCAKKGCVNKKDCGELGKVYNACSGDTDRNFAELAGCFQEPWNDPKCQ